MIRAICFDLLTGLLDSWTLWNAVAGDAEIGASLALPRISSAHVSNGERIVAHMKRWLQEAFAVLVGLSGDYAERLAKRYEDLQPWPEAGDVLRALREKGMALLAVVTNCSERLGRAFAARYASERLRSTCSSPPSARGFISRILGRIF